MPKPTVDYEELERLWRAIRRDYFISVELFAGMCDFDEELLAKADKAEKRLRKNWQALCDLNIDAAASLAHGFSQMSGVFDQPGNPNGPSEHRLRQLSELVEVAGIGREANPDVEVRTVGELVELGDEAIQSQVPDDLEDLDG